MSSKVTRILCIIFYVLVSVLIIFGLLLFLYEKQYFKGLSCNGLNKEFGILEIINLENNNNESIEAQNQNQTQPDIDFTGKYQMIKSENFDKFLEELGVGFLQRTLANRATPEYEITKDGDYYILRTISPFKTSEIRFNLNGEEFEENRLDGERVKSRIIQKGNKWIQNQMGEKNTVKIIREFKGDQIIVTGAVNNVGFLRIYKKIID